MKRRAVTFVQTEDQGVFMEIERSSCWLMLKKAIKQYRTAESVAMERIVRHRASNRENAEPASDVSDHILQDLHSLPMPSNQNVLYAGRWEGRISHTLNEVDSL
jgi:fibrillarin-like rRNA methylase